jgi:serine/threonine protein kinase
MNERIPVAPEGYALIRQIGRGASSVVWEARALATDAAVALKILDTDVAGVDALRTFARERDAMNALVLHPNILTILDADVHDGRPWIAMELCRRGSLASYVADGGPLEVPTALRVLERLAGALSVAHEAGVVHCDIKPANVMLTDGGEPAVGDFGIARVSVATATTTTGAAFTLDHVAPELLDDGRRSPRSDIYSLGTTAWQLLVGVPPFRQSGDVSIGTVLTRILRRPLPESEAIPDDVLALLRAMTAKDPEDRPESMADVAAAVRALAQERGVALDDAALPPLTSVQLQLIEIMSDRSSVPAPAVTEGPAPHPAPAVDGSGPASDVPATYVPAGEPDPATVLVAPGGRATVLQQSELVGVPLADSLPPTVLPIYERPASTGGPQPASRSRRVPLVAASVIGLLVAAGTVFGLQRSEAPEPAAPTPVAVEAPVTTAPPTTTTATPTPTTPESTVTSSATSSARSAAAPRRTRAAATRRATRRPAAPVPAPPVVRTPDTPDDPEPDSPTPDTSDKPDPSDSPGSDSPDPSGDGGDGSTGGNDGGSGGNDGGGNDGGAGDGSDGGNGGSDGSDAGAGAGGSDGSDTGSSDSTASG